VQAEARERCGHGEVARFRRIGTGARHLVPGGGGSNLGAATQAWRR
jgi:hypothetical protein